MMFVAAAAMMFASCDKDEGSNTPDNPPATLADNTLIYDGVTHNGTGAVSFFANDLQYVFDGDGFSVTGNIESGAYNRTVDLSRHNAGLLFTLHVGMDDLSITFVNNPQNFACSLNGDDLGATSCFTSGTATVAVANDTLTLTVDGTLTNGKQLKFKFSAGTPHGSPDANANEIVLGGSRHAVEPSLSISNEGVYLFSADNNDYHLIVDIPASMMGQTIPLHEMFGPREYYFNFSSPTLSFSQQMSSDNPFAIRNDVELTHPVFSNGTMRFFEENDSYTVIISGTLWDDNLFFSAQINVQKSDIQAMDNQIVVDGRVFEGNVMGTRYTGEYSGQYLLHIQGYDHSSGVSQMAYEMYFYFDSSLVDRTLDLTSSEGSYSLHGVQYLEPQWHFSQRLSGGIFYSRYEDNEEYQNVSLYTVGTLGAYEDEWAISLSHLGTLTNGHSISVQIRLDKSDFYESKSHKK